AEDSGRQNSPACVAARLSKALANTTRTIPSLFAERLAAPVNDAESQPPAWRRRWRVSRVHGSSRRDCSEPGMIANGQSWGRTRSRKRGAAGREGRDNSY